MSGAPSGLAVFLASGDMVAHPKRTAAKLLSCGASLAYVLVESVDGRQQPPGRVEDVCAALHEADIASILYTFPTPDRIKQAVIQVEACAGLCPHLSGVLLDIEPYGGFDWSERAIKSLFDDTHASRPDLPISFSVFTRPQWGRIDWTEAVGNADLVLQAYERARDAATLADAMTRWGGIRRNIPAIGTYAGDVARLRNDLGNVTPWAKRAGACAVWSLRTTDEDEADVLKAWTIETFAP